MGSDEGGLEELVELSWSRASRSAIRWSSSAIRHRSDSKTAMRATCASGGTVFQRDSGIGGVWLIHSNYILTVQKVRDVSAYNPNYGKDVPACPRSLSNGRGFGPHSGRESGRQSGRLATDCPRSRSNWNDAGLSVCSSSRGPILHPLTDGPLGDQASGGDRFLKGRSG